MDARTHEDESSIRVLVVDDQAVFANALEFLLRRQPRIDVVGVAGTGAEAIDLASTHDVDVVVMDVRMPGMDGFEATRQLLARRPRTRVLMISAADDDDEAAEAAAAGAAAFLRKDHIYDVVVDAILRSVDAAELH